MESRFLMTLLVGIFFPFEYEAHLSLNVDLAETIRLNSDSCIDSKLGENDYRARDL